MYNQFYFHIRHILYAIGVFLILTQNINSFVEDIKSEQGFQVFLTTDFEGDRHCRRVQKLGGMSYDFD